MFFLKFVLKTLLEGSCTLPIPHLGTFRALQIGRSKVYMYKITRDANFDLENQTNTAIVLVVPAE